MKLVGPFLYKYVRIVDKMKYCSFSPAVYGLNKEKIDDLQRDFFVQETDNYSNIEKIKEYLEGLYLGLQEYRNYMYNNAISVSKHNKVTSLSIFEDGQSGYLLSALEKISDVSSNLVFLLVELRKRNINASDLVHANETLKKEYILEINDFQVLSKEVLSVLYDIYEI